MGSRVYVCVHTPAIAINKSAPELNQAPIWADNKNTSHVMPACAMHG